MNDILDLNGYIIGHVPFVDIVPYLTPFSLALVVTIVVFTTFLALSNPELRSIARFREDIVRTASVGKKEARFRRFMTILCGVALIGVVTTGDIFNFALFVSLVGVTNIGIFAVVRDSHVLDAAFQYGLVMMMCTLPLFGGVALILAKTGTLSLGVLAGIPGNPIINVGRMLLLVGAVGEGALAPFFATKVEMIRAKGAPFINMMHLSSLMVFVRLIEILFILG
jgi:energy-converting hydrogenase A subunit H